MEQGSLRAWVDPPQEKPPAGRDHRPPDRPPPETTEALPTGLGVDVRADASLDSRPGTQKHRSTVLAQRSDDRPRRRPGHHPCRGKTQLLLSRGKLIGPRGLGDSGVAPRPPALRLRPIRPRPVFVNQGPPSGSGQSPDLLHRRRRRTLPALVRDRFPQPALRQRTPLLDRQGPKRVEVGNAKTVIALVPARTDTGWWHNDIAGQASIFFLKGRLSFGDGSQPAPFPSALIVWGLRACTKTHGL